MEQLQIFPLSQKPELAPVFASWTFGLWGSQIEGRTLARSLERAQKLSADNQIPMGFIALHNNRPAGIAALLDKDLETRPDLSPWLGSVYVHPFHRGQGIARALITACEEEARKQQIRTLYLVTEQARGLYEKGGWDYMGDVTSPYGNGCLMKKNLFPVIA